MSKGDWGSIHDSKFNVRVIVIAIYDFRIPLRVCNYEEQLKKTCSIFCKSKKYYET
jgi:hypothetical protein